MCESNLIVHCFFIFHVCRTKSNFVDLAHVPVPNKSPSTQLLEKSTFMPVLKISQNPLIGNTMPQQLSKVNTPLKQTESATTVDDSSSLLSSQSVIESSTFNNSFNDSQLREFLLLVYYTI